MWLKRPKPFKWIKINRRLSLKPWWKPSSRSWRKWSTTLTLIRCLSKPDERTRRKLLSEVVKRPTATLKELRVNHTKPIWQNVFWSDETKVEHFEDHSNRDVLCTNKHDRASPRVTGALVTPSRDDILSYSSRLGRIRLFWHKPCSWSRFSTTTTQIQVKKETASGEDDGPFRALIQILSKNLWFDLKRTVHKRSPRSLFWSGAFIIDYFARKR